MSLISSLTKAIKTKKERGWDKIYIAIDIHDTICTSTYNTNSKKLVYFDEAIECLRLLSERKDIVLILWSSMYDNDINEVSEHLKKENINIDYCNENPLEKNNTYACFDKKFYFNILLDDKAGFDYTQDWTLIKNFFNKH